MSHRPRSQQNQYDQLAQSSSPNKGFKTRVVYKNAKVDETTNPMVSLYGQSFNKAPQKPPSRGELSSAQSARISLADIGAMQRNAKTPNAKSKMDLLASPKGAQHDRRPPSQSGASELASPRTSEQEKARVQKLNQQHQHKALEKTGKTDLSAKNGVTQSMYDSQLLKEAMQKEFCDHPYINYDNDAEYYDAVRRLDYCGKCWAAQQKYYTSPFKIKHKGPGQSLYQRDYVKHPLEDQGPVLKNDFYTTWNNNEPMDFGTTMRNDYKPWKTGPVKKETMNFRPATTGIPFGGKSNYRSEYVNWGANVTAYEKPLQGTTIIPELPFMSKTTYRDNFSTPDGMGQLKPKDKDLWKQKNNKSPITTGLPFMGETTHAATYKPFKVDNHPVFEEAEEYEPTQALPDHQKSLYAKDFGAKPNWKCPAVIFMENHPHPKYKHLG